MGKQYDSNNSNAWTHKQPVNWTVRLGDWITRAQKKNLRQLGYEGDMEDLDYEGALREIKRLLAKSPKKQK